MKICFNHLREETKMNNLCFLLAMYYTSIIFALHIEIIHNQIKILITPI